MKNYNELWENIQSITSRDSTLLLQKQTTPQMQLLIINAHRYLLTQNIIHKNLLHVLKNLNGTMAQNNLTRKFIFASLLHEGKGPEQYQFWKTLFQEWNDYRQMLIERDGPLKLMDATLQSQVSNISSSKFGSLEGYIFYLNYIALDLIGIITKNQKISFEEVESQDVSKMIDKYRILQEVSIQEILFFLNEIVPKVLFNVILKKDYLPPSLQSQKPIECLFSNQQLQYCFKQSNNYARLVKWLIKIVLAQDQSKLKPTQQKLIMDVLFKYFYIYHLDKANKAVQLMIAGFNLLDQSVRYAMTEQFHLFLKIARKIGKGKMVDWMMTKSDWIKQINQKIDTKSVIGYAMQSLTPIPNMNFIQTLTIERGQTLIRHFQVLQQYSILYLQITVAQLDINVRIIHLGQLHNQRVSQSLPIILNKVSGTYFQIIPLVLRGLYKIEFDNSGSWINNKIIMFQKVLLTPLQMNSNVRYSWIDKYFMGVSMNSMVKDDIIIFNKRRIHGLANISQQMNGNYLLGLRLKRQDIYEEVPSYQYQTDNLGKFIGKIKEIKNSELNYEWSISNQVYERQNQLKIIFPESNRRDKDLSKQKLHKSNSHDILIKIT